MRASLGILAICAMAGTASGCFSSSSGDGSSGQDSGTDAPFDASTMDSTTPTDSGQPESSTDGGTESSTEASVADSSSGDASADATLDASVDAALDAPMDAPVDASQDAPFDAAAEGSSEASVVGQYASLADASGWATFDLSQSPLGTSKYNGAIFDGRYMYLSPSGNYSASAQGLVARVDTTASFQSVSSWSTFDLTTMNNGARGYVGGAFDGRYVYVSPSGNTLTGLWHDEIARYDTQATFGAASAWTIFQPSTVSSVVVGYEGVAFDGTYLYFVPYGKGELGGGGNSGLVARYTVAAGFTTASSWSFFDTASLAGSPTGFQGGAFDGRYFYMAPSGSKVVQYDTQAAGGFGATGSWSTFDISTLSGSPSGSSGVVFDGRYVYFLPSAGSVVVRYDTQGAGLSTASSWSTFDVSTINTGAAPGYGGAGVFDGRYLYLVTWNAQPFDLTRYDTTAPWASATSWQTLSLATVTDSGAGQFQGAGFDGQYVYFVPFAGSIVAQFNARTPRALPPPYHGSFY